MLFNAFYIYFISDKPFKASNHHRWRGWHYVNLYKPNTFLFLSQARTKISNSVCPGHFYVQWLEARSGCSFC